MTPLEVVEIDAQLVVGQIPTQAEMNDGADWPETPRGAKPLGDNSFVMVGTDVVEVVDVGATVQRTILDTESSIPYNDAGLTRLDHDRVLVLGSSSPVARSTVISTAGGTPHATANGGAAQSAGIYFNLVAPIDPGPTDIYSSQDRWLISDDRAWVDSTGKQGHAVLWIDRGRYFAYNNYEDYENYLISFTINGTEVPELAATKILLPPASTRVSDPDTWISGAAFPLTNSAFVVLDRIRTNNPTAQGYRRDIGQLRAFDYSGTQLAVSPELFTQTYDNGTNAGTTGHADIQRSADGTIVVLVQEQEYYPSRTPEGYSGYDVVSRFKMRRCTFAGSSWTMGPEKVVYESGHSNQASFVINFQEFQPGRFVIDSLRFTSAAQQYQNRTADRVLTILDSKFATEQEVVVPMPAVKYPSTPGQSAWFYDSQDWWSSFGSGNFGLMGWETYGGSDEYYNNIPHVATVQHSIVIPTIDPVLKAELRDLGQRFISNTLSGMS